MPGEVREVDEKDESETPAKRKTEPKAAAKRCSSGRVLIDGKCIEKGAAAGYCGPGYRPQGGKCVQGYQAPKANTPLSSEQKKAVNKGCPKGQVWNAPGRLPRGRLRWPLRCGDELLLGYGPSAQHRLRDAWNRYHLLNHCRRSAPDVRGGC